MNEKVVIIMGSEKDIGFIRPLFQLLDYFAVDYELRVASAHKTPKKLIHILEQYEDEEGVVYITVAGKSNALSGFVDANTASPVIACPPYSEKFGGGDVFSSLRMPSGVGSMIVLDPKNAALAAMKILSFKNPELSERVSAYRKRMRDEIEESDRKLLERSQEP